tara:strand:+ start:1026 stop:2015 length:990 start_codon:yes stop_codon:yes gene_type:complete
MKNYSTIILTEKEIRPLVSIKKAMGAVEKAFLYFGQGKTQMPPKLYINLKKYNGDFRAMPAAIDPMKACAIKWVNVHPDNRKKGLPTVMGLMILSDPTNGLPLAIMDATYATALRTGAAGGVAAKYLARGDSKVVSLVGCGAQARTQLKALLENFPIKEVKIWAHKKAYYSAFLKNIKIPKLNFISCSKIEECVKNSDIIVTTTPSRKPLIKLKWLKKGVHINAIGADAKGKQELESLILKKSKVVVDAWEQAAHSGEINVALRKKIISKKDIYADIGQIVSGKIKSRTNNQEITIFDSTGLAIQDIAIAQLIYKSALSKRIGKKIKFI